MIKSLVAGLLIPALALGVPLTTASAHGARSPQIRLTPRTVRIGGVATLTGSRLGARRYVTLVLKSPKGARPKSVFVSLAYVQGGARADAHGNLNVKVRIPIVTKCGRGQIYVSWSGSKTWSTMIPIKLTGCKPSKNKSVPPPPAPKHP